MSKDYMDDDNASDGFRDVPDEVAGAESPNVQQELANPSAVPQGTRRVFPTQKTVELPAAVQQYEEEAEESVEEEDYSEVLSDASLRLEQGNLYKMVMNSDLFANSGYDEKAVANVTREIRNFAKERMEIMLGMRQEATKEVSFSGDFPFNALEVEVLKMLASTATKGATQEAEPFTPVAVPRKQQLNPITVRGGNQRPVQKAPAKPLAKAPAAPLKRPKVSEAIQRILEEEGVTLDEINQVFDPNQKYLTPDELASLTPDQVIERNKQVAQRAGKSVANPAAIPMPPQEHIEAIYNNRAQQAAAHPQMQMIMNLIHNKK